MQHTMKKAALAAAFTVIGGAAALAQGMPPGGPWHSGWPGFVEAQRAQARNASGASALRLQSGAKAARNSGSVPVASNTKSMHRGS